MLPEALHGREGSASRDEELIEQEDDISILPVVAAYPGSPMDHRELPAIEVPTELFGVFRGRLVSRIILGPQRYTFGFNEHLLADDKPTLTGGHVLPDRFYNPLCVGTLVACGLEVAFELFPGVLGNVDDVEVVVAGFRDIGVLSPRDDVRHAINVGGGVQQEQPRT